VLLVSNSLLQPLVGWRFAHSQKAKMFGKTQAVGFCLASFRVELLSWEINFHLGITASWELMVHTGQKIIHTNMVGAWNFPSIEHANYLLHLIHCPILPFKTRKKKCAYHPHNSHHAMKSKIFLRDFCQKLPNCCLTIPTKHKTTILKTWFQTRFLTLFKTCMKRTQSDPTNRNYEQPHFLFRSA